MVLDGTTAAVTWTLVQDVELLAQSLRAGGGIVSGRVGNGFVEVDLQSVGVPEGFELAILRGPEGTARVKVRGEIAGLRGALGRIRQLLRQFHRSIPCLRLHDSPAFAVRGVLLDISRDRVPILRDLESIIDDLASIGYNHLQLYTEHAFAYAKHAQVWGEASPLDADDVKQLDAYCRARGIELAANQNCFGHLRAWLKHPEFADLAEIEPGGVWKFMHWERRGPFSLNPADPASLSFVRGLLEELLPLFTSERVNIGCDETFDVGWGRSRERVEARGKELMQLKGLSEEQARDAARAELFFEFVGKVCEVVREQGKKPLMWADIALHHPEMLGLLPRDVTGLVWGYEPESAFARGVQTIRDAGLSGAWVCPGTSNWRSITGRTREAQENMARAATEGMANGAEGYLVCEWGDMGHMQHRALMLRRLADGAQAAWTGSAYPADPRAVSLHVFKDDSLRIAGWLDELGEIDGDLRRNAHANYSPDPLSRGIKNATAIFNDLFPPVPVPETSGSGTSVGRAVDAPIEAWERVRENLSALQLDVLDYGDPLQQRELIHTVAFARFAAEHAIAWRIEDAATRTKRLRELVKPAEDLLMEHRALWHERSRLGGLSDSCAHLEKVIATLRTSDGAVR